MLRLRTTTLLALLTAPLGLATLAAEDRPSIVLISVDTLRADRLSTYGNPRPTSPAIDRLASQGIVFEQAYSQSPKTASSHMSLFTSLYPAAHGVRNLNESHDALPESIPTLAMLLSDAGYRSVAITSGGNVRGTLGFDRGFERYEHMRAAEVAKGPRVIFDAAGAVAEQHLGADPASPLFLFVHTYQTHDPYLPPEDYRERFTDPAYSGRIASRRAPLIADLDGRPAVHKSLSRAFWARVDADDPADREHLRALYDASVRAVDEQIGRFVARLDRLDPAGGLILIVLSDHGEEFYDHGAAMHNTVYQEVVRVPLVMRFPAADGLAPRRIPQTVRLIDVMPTLLERVGVPLPETLHGRSLRPVLLGEEETRPVFSEWRALVALRQDNWKLVRKGALKSELYDLDADPGEQNDLLAVNRERAAALSTTIDRILDACAAFGAGRRGAAVDPPSEELLEELRALGYLGGGAP